MYGITTKNITNANGVKILKGEKVQCLFVTNLGNNKYEGLFVTETGVKFLSDFSNVMINIKRRINNYETL